jgi:hypothetical protein
MCVTLVVALTTLALSVRLRVNRLFNAVDFAPRALWCFRADTAADFSIDEGGGDRVGPGGVTERGGGGKRRILLLGGGGGPPWGWCIT